MSTKKSLETFKDAFDKEVKIGDSVAYIKCAYQSAGDIHHGTVKRITPQGAWIIPDNKYKDDACKLKVYKMENRLISVTNWKPYYGKPKFVKDTIVADCYYAPYHRIIKY